MRRTAAFLLREFNNAESLKKLVPLLTDAEPLVQQKAVQGLMLNDSKEATVILLTALTTTKKTTRATLLSEVLKMQDQRTTPLYSYLMRQMDHNHFPKLYLTTIETLDTYDSTNAIEALKMTLHTKHWWTVFANQKYKTTTAQTLRRIGTVTAIDALRETAASGAPSARGAAKAELIKTA